MQTGALPITRRAALLGLGAAFTLGRASLALAAAPTENRFVVVLLRGALDGMSAVQPYGDPDCTAVRGALALAGPGSDGGLLDLGGFYGLHPQLANLHAMYKAGNALILHAAAGHYRSRSHFEAQDYLECGADQRLASGWLNRAVASMRSPPGHELALSMGVAAPLLLRGPATVAAWAPEHFGQTPPNEFYGRLLALSAHDRVIGPALAEGIKQRGMSPGDLATITQGGAVVLAGAAGRLLAAPNGPRVAALELAGWDTHNAQAQRLKQQLKQLDEALGALQAGLGDAWPRTAVLLVTEFGRTARINGTAGTDHGTAGVAFLLGGAVAGGRVRANWPGLGRGRLFEDRDLMPTTDVRAIAKGVLASHLGLGPAGLESAFPGSGDAQALNGLIRV
ncbi:MAG: DUF1501 domain-containing protein [Rhodospirillales bacterium]